MTLVLQGIALNEQPMSHPLIGRFDERGGTLGRSDTVTFTLPDPERMISRIQAQVLHRDDGYWIENVSAANPILHNGRPLSAGMRVLLRDGDELRVGGYTLRAVFEEDETSATILRGRTVITPLEVDSGAAPKAAPSAPEPAPGGTLRWAKSAGSSPGASVQTAVNGEDLWRGFLKGAGITLPLSEPPSIELLSTIGAMLRIAVEGLHRLVAMRTLAKDEIQAEMTVIQVRGNNPLKFAADAAVALQLMLKPPARGFLAGPAALRDALIDLQSHQVGVMAGMRSALDAVLDRFDPTKLEATLGSQSVFESLRPGRRKARLWELYLEHYRSLRQEAQEDFQHLFGKAFREAYEAQVRSLDVADEATNTTTPRQPRAGRENT
jgi:predicted component of type VI protein secretion system